MPHRPPPIARIRLARSWPRLLAVPVILAVAGLSVAVLAVLVIDGPLQYVGVLVAAVPVAAGILLGVRLATMRVEIEEAAVGIRWLGGRRDYALVPGPVTRVRLKGDGSSTLRARTGILGWQVGRGRLRGEERIEVVRLAPTRTAILVPTDRGRLAIAASAEPQLLEALSRAARARQRLDDLAGPDAADDEPDAPDASAGAVDDSALEIETPPHILTGIERAMLDEQLARQRTEAEAIAHAELARRAEAERSALELRAPAVDAPGTDEPPADRVEAATARQPIRIPSLAIVALPLVATLAVWAVALVTDRLPDPSSDAGRLTALALVMAGPATAVGAIMARSWWPRLVGLVVASGLAATVFVGRAILVS